MKQLKAELAELLEEDAKYDKLRSLPLYSCRITGWKFVCSNCYDKIYLLLHTRDMMLGIDYDLGIPKRTGSICTLSGEPLWPAI
jgi:hypothetical protein